MIELEKRKAIYQMHLAGMSARAISERMGVSRGTVKGVIDRQGQMPTIARKDRIHVDSDLLRRLYQECGGWKQRIHERLVEEEKIAISYPTLTRLLRKLGIGRERLVRCDSVPDEPGLEMQHDTTVYTVTLGGQRTKLVASVVYLRYSKRRYLKFYRSFNRFAMKCFLHEALMFWGYAAKQCVIDNTNLARWLGSGSRAVIALEMVAFGKQYGFVFLCHELGHCNRKAGEERSFWTVETNFLPGRTFENLADLNRQALEWATVRMHHRPVGKAGLIPAKAFEHEQMFLTKLPAELPAPYCSHERGTDQYGYAQFRGNYYWVPGTKREPVKVFEYADRLKIFQQGQLLAEYPLPDERVTNQRFSPPGQPRPRSWPQNQRRSSEPEEQRLRAMSAVVADYVEFAVKVPGIQRHRFVRELFALSRKVTRDVFLQTVERALKYRVADLRSLHRIAWYCQSQGGYLFDVTGTELFIDEDFRDRPAYREGCLTDEPDLSRYDGLDAELDAELDSGEPDGDGIGIGEPGGGGIGVDEPDGEPSSDEPPSDDRDEPDVDDIPW